MYGVGHTTHSKSQMNIFNICLQGFSRWLLATLQYRSFSNNFLTCRNHSLTLYGLISVVYHMLYLMCLFVDDTLPNFNSLVIFCVHIQYRLGHTYRLCTHCSLSSFNTDLAVNNLGCFTRQNISKLRLYRYHSHALTTTGQLQGKL